MKTIALAFTDIVDSTGIGNKLGDLKWVEVVMEHFNKAWEYKSYFNGYEIKRIGDAYMAAFHTAPDAFRFAWSFAQDAWGYPKGEGHERLLIRVGINVGQVRIIDDDIYGRMVNFTSRVQHELDGPGIMLSDAAKEDVISEVGEEQQDFMLQPNRLSIKSFGQKTVWRVLPHHKLEQRKRGFFKTFLLGSSGQPETKPTQSVGRAQSKDTVIPASTTQHIEPPLIRSQQPLSRPTVLKKEQQTLRPRRLSELRPPDMPGSKKK
jgi:class 3 adenylate cyclase